MVKQHLKMEPMMPEKGRFLKNDLDLTIDNIQEAKKVFVGQMAGTLFTIASVDSMKYQHVQVNPDAKDEHELLTDSKYKGSGSFEDVLRIGEQAKGKDIEGYRSDFIRLVEACKLLRK